jgi:hypothetical protein
MYWFSDGEFVLRLVFLHPKMETDSFQNVVWCGVLCCDNGKSSNKYN